MNKKEGLREINKMEESAPIIAKIGHKSRIREILQLKKPKNMNQFKFKQNSKKTRRLTSDQELMIFSKKVASSKNLCKHVRPFQRKILNKTKLKKHSNKTKIRNNWRQTKRLNASLEAKRMFNQKKSLADSEYNFRANKKLRNPPDSNPSANVFSSKKFRIIRSNSQSISSSKNVSFNGQKNLEKSLNPKNKHGSRHTSRNSGQMKIYVAPLHLERNASSSVKSDSRFIIKNPRRTVESVEDVSRQSQFKLFNTRIHRSNQNSISPIHNFQNNISEDRKTSHEEYSFPFLGNLKFNRSVKYVPRNPQFEQVNAHRQNLFAKNFLHLLKNFFQTKIVLLKCKFMNQLKRISLNESRTKTTLTMKSSLDTSQKNSFTSKTTKKTNLSHEQTILQNRVAPEILEPGANWSEPADSEATDPDVHFSG